MNLIDTIIAAGMTPPSSIAPGKWTRFPGIGKGKSNRAGWCRVISPTLAVFGDWSTGVSETWRDETHRDDAESARLLREARQRTREYIAQQRWQQDQAAASAAQMIEAASLQPHPYLRAKGFPDELGLVDGQMLVVPVRDAAEYNRVISVQRISPSGEKKFLFGGRTRGGIYRIGAPMARKTVLCEGYATGLTLDTALKAMQGTHAVIVCFSATNLKLVAELFPGAVVCADNDVTKTGEEAAKSTRLKWIMPPEAGMDFNDWHQRDGIIVVREALRGLFG
jgi:putative DNA primase/helicase